MPEEHVTMNPGELQAMLRGSRIGEVMSDVEEVIDHLSKVLMRKVFLKLEKDELSPQEARDAWAQLYAYRKLVRQFDRLTNEAQSVGSRMKQIMEEDDA